MHELGIARDIVAIVSDAAQGRNVRRVTLEVGALSGVMTEAIAFCFPIAAEGSVLEGVELEIREIEGRARCAASTTERTRRRTDGWRGEARSASAAFVRSAASVYWTRSFVPMLKKSTTGASASAISAADGTSIITPSRTSVATRAPSSSRPGRRENVRRNTAR